MKLRSLFNHGVQSLLTFTDTPELDARILLEHVTNLSKDAIYLQPTLELSPSILEEYNKLIYRRINYEPVAKIIGKKSFWKHDFMVNNHVLDPRPDSEVIIEYALKLLSKNKPYRFLDLGTGSGCLILSILHEFENATGIAIDISPNALEVAKANAKTLSLEDRVSFINQNWADGLTEEFDLIISNPPYIPTQEIRNLSDDVKLYDPNKALDGGHDGLDCYRYLAKQMFNILKNDAYAILEFGYGQSLYIQHIFKQYRYEIHKILLDLNGIERAIIVRKL